MNSFSEKHHSLDNVSLLDIVQSPEKFHPDAVASAKQELSNRNLTDELLKQADIKLILKKEKEVAPFIKESKQVFKWAIAKAIKLLTPKKKADTKTEAIISIITVCYGLLFSADLFNTITSTFTFNIENSDTISLLYFYLYYPASVLFLCATLVLFWFRKKIGWILMSAFLLYSSINVLALFISRFYWGIPEPTSFRLFTTYMSTLISFGFYVASYYFILGHTLRTHYTISKKDLIKSIFICLGYIATILLFYTLLG